MKHILLIESKLIGAFDIIKIAKATRSTFYFHDK